MLRLLLMCCLVSSIWAAALKVGVCPPEFPLVHCLRNPCDGAPCPLRPTATCVPNYCGGCYDTWMLNGEQVYCWGP